MPIPPLHLEESCDMREYHLDTLDNGLRLLTVEMPHLHSIEMVCYVGIGSRYETPETAGISHFLEHMLFRGSRDYPTSQILEAAFEAIGGMANAATDSESTCFHSRIHPAHLQEGAALFASLLQQPLLNGLEIERRIILEEALEDLNQAGRLINPDSLTARLLWPEHPLSLPSVGSQASISGLTLADLQQHHQLYYGPSNTVIALAGRVTRSQALGTLGESFAAWQGQPAPPPCPAPDSVAAGPATSWVKDSNSQVNLQLSFRLPGWRDSRNCALRLLRRLLSGGGTARLMRRLRDELGLTYHVEANLGLHHDCGVLSVDLAVVPESLPQALAEVLDIFSDLCARPPAEEELQRTVRSFLYDLEFSQDQPDGRAARFAWGELVGYPLTLEGERQAILALKGVDLQTVAAELLRPEALHLVVVGPFRARDRKTCEQLLAAYRQA